MLRVLQVVNVMDRAGLETMLMNYYRKIDRTRVQFDFLTHRPDEGAYEEEIRSMGGKVYHAPRLYPQNYAQYYKFMKAIFISHPEYKIIHSHIDTMSVFPLYAAKINQIPMRIAHSHTSKLDIDAKLPIKYLAKLMVPHVANLKCACGIKAGEFLFGKREYKVINNAIDLGKFQFDMGIRTRKRGELGIQDEFVIGHVGRYSYIKNQTFLIDVFKEILRINPKSKLLLIGKGEEEFALRKKAADLQLDDKILFLVDRPDVHELYQAMDVFVMPSLFEGLPVVGIEAQANGVPCVVSDSISDEILLTDVITSMSINKSPEEWAKKIISIQKDRRTPTIEQLKVNGYDVQLESSKLVEWYEGLMREFT